MKYPDGRVARLGDRVKLCNGDKGVIVFSIDTNEFSKDFPKETWSYLGKGVMIRTDEGALFRHEDPNNDFIFLDE